METGSGTNRQKRQMNARSVGFIGAGRVTRILLAGLRCQGGLPAAVTASDPDPAPVQRLRAAVPEVEAGTVEVVASRGMVFLAVHPPAIADVAGAIKARLAPDAIVVSLAPKFTIARLAALLGGFERIARVIPNAPSLVGHGFNPVAFGPALSESDRGEILSMLSPLGDCPEVAEDKLEGYAVLTAMGPTYLWFQLQALREVAAGFGLSEEEIVPALKRMVCGATRTLFESGLAPAAVVDLVPIRPLAEMETQVEDMYRTRLPALHRKIKP